MGKLGKVRLWIYFEGRLIAFADSVDVGIGRNRRQESDGAIDFGLSNENGGQASGWRITEEWIWEMKSRSSVLAMVNLRCSLDIGLEV